ncbi:DUF4259 domain-containing protein [Micromonosporaceae bacterium B7E4]
MGTWDDGPFDNDSAADWCGDLHYADPSARAAIVRAALTTAAFNAGYLDHDDAASAIAATAIVASQMPGGEPMTSPYAPDFRLAGESLDLWCPLLSVDDRLRTGLWHVVGTRSASVRGRPTSCGFPPRPFRAGAACRRAGSPRTSTTYSDGKPRSNAAAIARTTTAATTHAIGTATSVLPAGLNRLPSQPCVMIYSCLPGSSDGRPALLGAR